MNKFDKIYCFFEQSGAFKNEFIKLGFPGTVDVDISNDFNCTDIILDLFSEIEFAYSGAASIFDSISSSDLIFAFFPCTRFSCQFMINFNCKAFGLSSYSERDKALRSIRYSHEIDNSLRILNEFVIICLDRKIPLIIENPYDPQSYLVRHWCFDASIVDYDRAKRGDYYHKPTQYFFFNFKPSNNVIFEFTNDNCLYSSIDKVRGFDRSIIHPEYANRFIREFIL